MAYLAHPVGNWTSFAVSQLLIYFYVLHSLSADLSPILSAEALCEGGSSYSDGGSFMRRWIHSTFWDLNILSIL